MFSVDWRKGTKLGKFLIRHRASGKYMHPHGGSKHAGNNTKMVLYNGYHAACYFYWFPVKEYPGYGIIRQATSAKFLHPYGGSDRPGNNTPIVYYSGYRYATLWAFMDNQNTIRHIGGKTVHPRGGSTNPGNNTPAVLHSGTHAGSKFNAWNGRYLNTHQPVLSRGHWRLL